MRAGVVGGEWPVLTKESTSGGAGVGRLASWAWATFLIGGALGTTLPGQLLLLVETIRRQFDRRRKSALEAMTDPVFLRLGWSFLAAALISAAFSRHPTMALAMSLGFVLLFFVVALGTRDAVILFTTRDCRRILLRILIAAVGCALNGIYTRFGLGYPRAEGFAFGPNSFGGAVAFWAIFAIGLSLESRRIGWWLLSIPVLLTALASSMSRGSWMGFASSVLLFSCLLVMRHKRYLKWALAVCIGIFAVSALAMAYSSPLRERFVSMFSVERNMDRILIWQTAVEMIKDRPLTGVGGGVFPLVYKQYVVEGEARSTMSFAHNLPLHILAEYGVLGFIPFFGLIGYTVIQGWRLARRSGPLIMATYSGFIGMLVHELVDNVIIDMNYGALFWFLAGFHVHLYKLRSSAQSIDSSSDREQM